MSDDDDIIYGLAGSDRIHGLGGDDILFGGTGYDYLYGDSGDDILFGLEDPEGPRSQPSDGDSLNGGTGNDTYYIDTRDRVVESSTGGIDTVISYHSINLNEARSAPTLKTPS